MSQEVMEKDIKETAEQIIAENKVRLHEVIGLLGDAPEGHLDKAYAAECGEFTSTRDPVLFLRNLRDKIVHTSGGSEFTVGAISAALVTFPEETAAELALRRANLKAELGITDTDPEASN